jgi:hypothetical protein
VPVTAPVLTASMVISRVCWIANGVGSEATLAVVRGPLPAPDTVDGSVGPARVVPLASWVVLLAGTPPAGLYTLLNVLTVTFPLVRPALVAPESLSRVPVNPGPTENPSLVTVIRRVRPTGSAPAFRNPLKLGLNELFEPTTVTDPPPPNAWPLVKLYITIPPVEGTVPVVNWEARTVPAEFSSSTRIWTSAFASDGAASTATATASSRRNRGTNMTGSS